MRKDLLIAALLVVSTFAAGACQTYTKGLQDTVTKADETAAIAAMRTITAAQQAYNVSNNGSYGTFDQLVKGGYLDSRFNSAKPNFKGYVLTLTIKEGPEGSYSVNADPEPPLAGRHFYFDSVSGVNHVNASQTASASDPALEQ